MRKSTVIGLEAYKKKGNLSVTSEPAVVVAPEAALRMFLVQKHAAHRAGLHWDFRLEHDGVLWS